MDDSSYNNHLKAIEESRRVALQRVEAVSAPFVFSLAPTSFSGVEGKSSDLAFGTLRDVEGVFGDDLSGAMAAVVRVTWYSVIKSLEYIRQYHILVNHLESEFSERHIGYEDWANREGFAWSLYEFLSEVNRPSEASAIHGYSDFLDGKSDVILLKVLSVYCFSRASDFSLKGRFAAAFDWLHEARDALECANGLYMWDQALEHGQEPVNLEALQAEARREVARKAASVKHKENRQMKAEAFSWFSESYQKFGSKDSCAEALTRQVPVAFRTARFWLDDWLKLRSASRL